MSNTSCVSFIFVSTVVFSCIVIIMFRFLPLLSAVSGSCVFLNKKGN